MNRPTEHLSFEVLNDYVDGRLDRDTNRLVAEHVAECQECSTELRELRMLLEGVASLPRTVLPTDDIWQDLKSSIDRSKEAVLPVAGRAGDQGVVSEEIDRSARRHWWRLAVAAVVLVVASSGITAIVLRGGGSGARPSNSPVSEARISASGAPVLPASFRVAEGEYVSTIEELRAAFDEQRSQLTPQTVRTVDRSLAVIDSAITEARAALLSDPGNRTLVDLLSATYQRKLDLLRRTSELTPRT